MTYVVIALTLIVMIGILVIRRVHINPETHLSKWTRWKKVSLKGQCFGGIYYNPNDTSSVRHCNHPGCIARQERSGLIISTLSWSFFRKSSVSNSVLSLLPKLSILFHRINGFFIFKRTFLCHPERSVAESKDLLMIIVSFTINHKASSNGKQILRLHKFSNENLFRSGWHKFL